MNEDSETNAHYETGRPAGNRQEAPGYSLTHELRALYLEFLAEMPANERQTLIGFLETLASSDVTADAKRVGDWAPDFRLIDSGREEVHLAYELKKGPVVLSFFRGVWCRFCILELLALEQAYPDIRRFGASLLGISPERATSPTASHRLLDLSYPVLVDTGNAVARAFGLTFQLPGSMRQLYGKWGHDLPSLNGDESWELPVPATYVIDENGSISAAYVDKDHTRRMEPSEIIFTLENLNRERNKKGRNHGQ